MYKIYAITNKENNKTYIGSTNDIERRWKQHKENSVREGTHHYMKILSCAFRKYGISNFEFKVLVDNIESEEEVRRMEELYIRLFDTVAPNGYNATYETFSPMRDKAISDKVAQTKRDKYGKRVAQMKDGEIVGLFNSLVEAQEGTGCDRFKISDVCHGRRRKTGEFEWRFIDEDNNIVDVKYDPTPKSTKKGKQVAKVDMKTDEVLEVYQSAGEAGRENGCDSSGVSKVCRGVRKSCGGFKWKYLED